MDMQKEKIAHEKHLLSQGVDFKYLPNIQYNELENIYELIEWDEEYSEALNEINSSWCTWQAAKSQAIPEGFVLVPKAPTDITIARMINTPIEVNLLCDHADIFLSEGEAYIAYQAMIEAQEPTND